MARKRFPVTAAIRTVREHGVSFVGHFYKYQEKGVSAGAARELGLDEHLVIKTIVMEDDRALPFIVLMHGDRHVSAKAMARSIGAKSARPCLPENAQKHTGYMVGGISPFGTPKALPVYIEASILSLPRIYINAGKRGFMMEISPRDLERVLRPVFVHVAR